jgi:hypothetical protein
MAARRKQLELQSFLHDTTVNSDKYDGENSLNVTLTNSTVDCSLNHPTVDSSLTHTPMEVTSMENPLKEAMAMANSPLEAVGSRVEVFEPSVRLSRKVVIDSLDECSSSEDFNRIVDSDIWDQVGIIFIL